MTDFNTIIKETLPDSDGRCNFYKNEVLELMKIVRKEAIKNCAKKTVKLIKVIREETIKECANKMDSQADQHTVLSLDKNSLDL